MKQSPLLFSVLLIASMGALGSCTNMNHGAKFPTGSISHVVVCYLKNHGDAAERQKLVDATRELRSIPGIENIEVGYALPSTRPVVVSDFDVALVITFRDAAALDAYQTN